ncbi:MAG: hypothetical protein PHT07_12785 [Paludibacter sp.]|nr:hypothetical protein [Paludibacter sp.]
MKSIIVLALAKISHPVESQLYTDLQRIMPVIANCYPAASNNIFSFNEGHIRSDRYITPTPASFLYRNNKPPSNV